MTPKIQELLLSRKFWAMISTVSGVMSGAAAGTMSWPQALFASSGVVSAWIVAQGIVDAKKVELDQ